MHVGTWFYNTNASLGDSVRQLRLAISDDNGVAWGTAVGLGWTPTLQVRAIGDPTLLLTITGSWEDASEAAATFAIGLATTLVPAAGVVAQYEAQLVMTNPGFTSIVPTGIDAQPITFNVQRWP